MFSILCHTNLLKRHQLSLHVIESMVQQCCAQERRHLSTSAISCNSGRFRKMKQAESTFLKRSPVKQVREADGLNPALCTEFLDKSVEKLLQGENKSRYRFLLRKRPLALEEDTEHHRDNVINDWNHIHETVLDLGVPEFADIIGGQMFAGNNLRTTTTSCLTLRLADNVKLLRDSELRHVLLSVYCWPGDAGHSETLERLVAALDTECALRCGAWPLADTIALALIWARFSFKTENHKFSSKVLEMSASKVAEAHLELLLSYLLLVSYSYHNLLSLQLQLRFDDKMLKSIEEKLTIDFWSKMDQTEVAMVYTALNLIWQRTQEGGCPVRLKQKIENTYGFRL